MGVPFNQAAMTSGETVELLARRTDIKAYYTSLEKARNVIPPPHGGIALRGGLRFWTRPRSQMTPVALTAAMISLVGSDSGTAADLIDGASTTEVTFPAGSSGPLLTIDFGAATTFTAFDLIGYTSEGGGSDVISVQRSDDGVTWTVWQVRDCGNNRRTRRFCNAPQDADMTTRYLRVAYTAPRPVFKITGLAVFASNGVKSAYRIIRHQTAESGSYAFILSDRHVDIWSGYAWIGAAPIPHVSTQLRRVTSAHSYDTAILFHPDVRAHRLMRQGGADEWDGAVIDFTGIPTESFSGGPVEPMMSEARGWPACGCFWQGRLCLGGFRSLPQSVVLSKLSEPYDLDGTGALATDAMRFDLEGDEYGIPMIRRLRAGQRLEVATQIGIYISSLDYAAKGTNLAFPIAERIGIEQTSRMVDTSDGAFFIQDGAAVLRQLVFDDSTSEKYTTRPVSVLAPHLVANAIDMVRRPSRSTGATDQIHIMRQDGLWSLFFWLPSDDISGFVPFETVGPIREIGMLDDYAVALGVGLAAGDVICVYDDAYVLDLSVARSAAAVMTGLDHLTGRNDVALIQGSRRWEGLSVIAGALALPQDAVAGTMCEIGVPFTWEACQHRLAGDSQRQIALNRQVSLAVVELDLDHSGPFELAVDDGPWRKVDARRMGTLPFDPSTEQRMFSGVRVEDGFLGGKDGKVRLRGTSLWPFYCRAILRDARW